MAFSFNGRSDEWKGRCNSSPYDGKLHFPYFTMNVCLHLMGVPTNRTSMSGKVNAMCRPPAAHSQIAPPAFYDKWTFLKNQASKLNETKRKQTNTNEDKRKQTKLNENHEIKHLIRSTRGVQNIVTCHINIISIMATWWGNNATAAIKHTHTHTHTANHETDRQASQKHTTGATFSKDTRAKQSRVTSWHIPCIHVLTSIYLSA